MKKGHEDGRMWAFSPGNGRGDGHKAKGHGLKGEKRPGYSAKSGIKF